MLESVPPEVKEVVVLSVMNPGTLLAGYLIGKRASEPQKIVVAAFAAGIAGVAFAWLLMMTGLTAPKARLFSGIFIASCLLGAGWAWLGYSMARGAKRE